VFAVRLGEDAVVAVERERRQVISPPFDLPFGRSRSSRDPWGASFEVIRLNEG